MSVVLEYYRDIEAPVAQIFLDMQNRGIKVDLDYLRELQTYLEDQREPLIKEIKNELGDINLNSPKQLLEALHAKEIYPEFKGKASTDKRALERLKTIPVIERLCQFSELETLLSSFVYPYLERGQETVNPWFNQVGTRTGRPSCSNPNLLQIPKRSDNGKLVRRMFISRDGYILGDSDYSSIEPRMLAHLSKDVNMCQMFSQGIDFHDYTSERLRIDRDRAKILNLSVGYRATFKSVSQQLKCSDSEAQREIDQWWSMFSQLKNWQDQLIWKSKKDGYCTTLMGRRIKVDNLNEYNKWKREAAQRQLINNICQASAAEVMKTAMIKVAKSGIHILIQVYDELVTEHRKDLIDIELNQVKELMEGAVKLDIPLIVESKKGLNWGEVT